MVHGRLSSQKPGSARSKRAWERNAKSEMWSFFFRTPSRAVSTSESLRSLSHCRHTYARRARRRDDGHEKRAAHETQGMRLGAPSRHTAMEMSRPLGRDELPGLRARRARSRALHPRAVREIAPGRVPPEPGRARCPRPPPRADRRGRARGLLLLGVLGRAPRVGRARGGCDRQRLEFGGCRPGGGAFVVSRRRPPVVRARVLDRAGHRPRGEAKRASDGEAARLRRPARGGPGAAGRELFAGRRSAEGREETSDAVRLRAGREEGAPAQSHAHSRGGVLRSPGVRRRASRDARGAKPHGHRGGPARGVPPGEGAGDAGPADAPRVRGRGVRGGALDEPLRPEGAAEGALRRRGYYTSVAAVRGGRGGRRRRRRLRRGRAAAGCGGCGDRHGVHARLRRA